MGFCAFLRVRNANLRLPGMHDRRRQLIEANRHMATKVKATKSTQKALEATAKKRIRKMFGNIHEVVKMPNLIEV